MGALFEESLRRVLYGNNGSHSRFDDFVSLKKFVKYNLIQSFTHRFELGLGKEPAHFLTTSWFINDNVSSGCTEIQHREVCMTILNCFGAR